MRFFFVLLLLLSSALAQQTQTLPTFQSVRSDEDVSLGTDPSSSFWRAARPIRMDADFDGRHQSEYRTEVRSRWTDKYIYFLFTCPFKHLYLKPGTDVVHETNQLWNWNVAEVFLGADFQDIKRYREFEISPNNEWIDLDVDLKKPHHEEGWVWNSGFEHRARIDRKAKIWYAAVKIPFSAISSEVPKPGTKFRANFYRTEGPPESSKEIMWSPTLSKTFHVPERFGLLELKSK